MECDIVVRFLDGSVDASFFPKRPDLLPEVHPASCSGYIGDVLRGVKLPCLGSNGHLAPVCTSHYCRQFAAFVQHKFSIFPSYLGSFPEALILQSVPVIAVYVGRVFYLITVANHFRARLQRVDHRKGHDLRVRQVHSGRKV